MKIELVKLGDIYDITSGGTPSRRKKEYYFEGDIPWIKTGDLKTKYVSTASEYITNLGLENSSAKLFPKGTVLIAMYGATIGNCSILEIEASTNQACAAFRPIKAVLPEFLYYYLTYIKEKLVSLGVGGAQPNISIGILKNIDFPMIPLDRQNRIISILNKSQELIEKRKAQIEALDQLTQSVFLEMFGDPVTNPNGWEIVNLQDIADYFIGLTYKPNDVSDEGIVVLRSSNIQNGVIDLNDIVRVKKEVNDKLLVKQNDILMCSRNGSARLVGKVALIPELEERMTFGAFMTIIRSRYYCYLYNYFQSSAFRRQITSGATTTINQITKKMLNYVKLPLPPTSLQNEFAHKVEQIQHQKEILQTSLLELENMYNSLMQKAFKGELFTEEKVSNL